MLRFEPVPFETKVHSFCDTSSFIPELRSPNHPGTQLSALGRPLLPRSWAANSSSIHFPAIGPPLLHHRYVLIPSSLLSPAVHYSVISRLATAQCLGE